MQLLEVNGYKLRGSNCGMFVFASDLSKGVNFCSFREKFFLFCADPVSKHTWKQAVETVLHLLYTAL